MSSVFWALDTLIDTFINFAIDELDSKHKTLSGINNDPPVALLIHNRIANGHYHMLPDGEVVHHYHPYDKSESGSSDSPFAGHHHSAVDFNIIAMITGGVIFWGFVFTFFGFLIAENLRKILQALHCFLPRLFKSYADARAPPVFHLKIIDNVC